MSDFFNIPGLRIEYVGSTASGDPWHCWQDTTLCVYCRSLCQDCTHMKYGPVTIGEDITISGECRYCTISGIKQMQIVDGAVVKCSGYKRKELD